MSCQAIEIALQQSELRGELRLAFIAVGDNGGRATIPSIQRWTNGSADDAAFLLHELHDLGYLSFIEDDHEFYAPQMMPAPEARPAVEGQKKWSISSEIRAEIYKRDGWQCHYCGSCDDLTLDHKTPRSKGGGDHPSNLLTACRSCNSRKGTKSYDEFLEFVSGGEQ